MSPIQLPNIIASDTPGCLSPSNIACSALYYNPRFNCSLCSISNSSMLLVPLLLSLPVSLPVPVRVSLPDGSAPPRHAGPANTIYMLSCSAELWLS